MLISPVLFQVTVGSLLSVCNYDTMRVLVHIYLCEPIQLFSLEKFSDLKLLCEVGRRVFLRLLDNLSNCSSESVS